MRFGCVQSLLAPLLLLLALPVGLCGCLASQSEMAAEDDPWRRFSDRLGEASALIHASSTPDDPVTIADGYQILPRLLRLAWEHAYEYADPAHPILFRSTDAYLTNGWQTNDAVYETAIIDGTRTYRLRGRRGTAPLLELTANEGFDGMQGASRMVSSITEEGLEVAADGSIDVLIGPDVEPGKGLRTTPRTNFLFVRQYAHDWSGVEAARLSIEAVDEAGRVGLRPSQAAPDVEAVEEALTTTLDYLVGYLEAYHARATGLLAIARNRMIDFDADGPDEGSTMPAGHRFGVAMFDIGGHEALWVEFEPSEAPYWAFQTGNFWGETPAYRELAATTLNDRAVVREPDGSVRIVVIQGRCPATLRNCLTTVGRKVGSLIYRQSRQLADFPSFRTRVVDRASIETHSTR
jgi:hypothetical protein